LTNPRNPPSAKKSQNTNTPTMNMITPRMMILTK
jgi:hypothetical protein